MAKTLLSMVWASNIWRIFQAHFYRISSAPFEDGFFVYGNNSAGKLLYFSKNKGFQRVNDMLEGNGTDCQLENLQALNMV